MLWNLIITILLGALVGWLAGKIMEMKGSFWLQVILGIVGSFVGRFIARILGARLARVSVLGIIFSVAGACLVIWIVRKVSGKKK